LVDDAHPAAAQLAEHLVARDARQDALGRRDRDGDDFEDFFPVVRDQFDAFRDDVVRGGVGGRRRGGRRQRRRLGGRRRGGGDGRGLVEAPGRPGPVQGEAAEDEGGVFGEAAGVLVQVHLLAALPAQLGLVVDQLHDGLGGGAQRRVLFQVG